MQEINGWSLAADICKTIQWILAESAALPFSEAKVEQPAGAGRKRRDLTLYDDESRPVLTGKIRLPDRPDGQSRDAGPLVKDAFQKANAKGVEHLFNWNVNRFVLWKTFEAGKPIAERHVDHFNVTSIARGSGIASPNVRLDSGAGVNCHVSANKVAVQPAPWRRVHKRRRQNTLATVAPAMFVRALALRCRTGRVQRLENKLAGLVRRYGLPWRRFE